ncbi:YaaC family protein [Ectobacillus ponti]|uniref:YaaC family protein n=1 Tax=Ectobacillus ponti TaxID=2961894 RepID=A0AA42BRG3_9BACI|nr:YaaC family protein [Ectobacillus ponti]MCP8971365.1 YaaC family protein [Ectobacillus ponti]
MIETNWVWQKLSFFISSVHSQNYLCHCYKKLGMPDSEKKSFENCYPFIYYLEHGKSYYELAKSSPLAIQPVLLFYGMVQLLKACLLTVDPNYPESTAVLAHGVTTRKLKKQSYEFLQDEVKIQKNGLFTHIAERMFHMKHLEGEKFIMESLLEKVAELFDLFTSSKKSSIAQAVKYVEGETLCVPVQILDRYHMTKERFVEYFEHTCFHLGVQYDPAASRQSRQLVFKGAIQQKPVTSPLMYDLQANTYFLPNQRENMGIFPELLTHYLVLYNLSMISRYETEWWSDLLRSYSTEDYPFIHQFLSVTLDKVPYLIYLYLADKIK